MSQTLTNPAGFHVKHDTYFIYLQERMSLKHRGGSKFMKQQMIYGKYDDKVSLDNLVSIS